MAGLTWILKLVDPYQLSIQRVSFELHVEMILHPIGCSIKKLGKNRFHPMPFMSNETLSSLITAAKSMAEFQQVGCYGFGGPVRSVGDCFFQSDSHGLFDYRALFLNHVVVLVRDNWCPLGLG